MPKKYFSRTLALCLGVLAMVLSLSYIALAWTEPSVPAPGNNVPAPVNVGSTDQTKIGGLRINGLLYSKGLFVADGTGAFGNGLNVMAGGKVGIGTQTPNVKLDVVGKIHATGDICTDAGPSGGRCLSDGGGTSGNNYWTRSGNNIYNNNSGNVGIGNTSPSFPLEIESSYRISPIAIRTTGRAVGDSSLFTIVPDLNGTYFTVGCYREGNDWVNDSAGYSSGPSGKGAKLFLTRDAGAKWYSYSAGNLSGDDISSWSSFGLTLWDADGNWAGKIKLQSVSPTTCDASNLGRIEYHNNHFYGCAPNGSGMPIWKQLDN